MYVTRFGRVVKKPDMYKPDDSIKMTDDYDESEYDSHDSDVSSEVVYSDDEESSESDADSEGNLDGFVLKDDENNTTKSQDGNSDDSAEDA